MKVRKKLEGAIAYIYYQNMAITAKFSIQNMFIFHV